MSQCNTEKPQPKIKEVIKEVKKDTTHNISYITGQFDPKTHPLFIEIDSKYADRKGLFLRKEAMVAFMGMSEAAKKEGINLQIVSATRNFDYQKRIWENKWTGNTKLSDGTSAADIKNLRDRAIKILLYSSMPGTSRHHWGTDIDLNKFTNSWFSYGEGLKLYKWMFSNAASYGFCQVYSEKGTDRTEGYEEEKWHWTYMPLSKPLTLFAQEHLRDEYIQGFKGAETAKDIQVVKKYVLGIHPSCF